ncbi:MAG: ATP-dependent DNA ligase [Acidocella sp. 20-57-95]|nr:MAG: ATP-dependent DNA ligase [Acidocella sp. 20-57-95]OYV62368.1 MAG: ATP-dependent DNA ligase [Acidocella sp. 21-58-7]HQT63708.1 cisplatin damage response ATP-dependent DNA ligase [Acidocella sp.]HQU03905.1 cisplatin damage response ATP-dependent DNA ligase [Acidocella sp.]
MKAFANLLERLLFSPGRNAKITLLKNYFTTRPDPERGFALAVLAGALEFPGAKPAMLRALAEARTDPALFALSYDFVGDLAETLALIWPRPAVNAPPELPEVIASLRAAKRHEIPNLVASWLDVSDVSTRIALIKLMTGGLRVGASLRLAKLALAELGGIDVQQIDEVWHSLTPPYADLFAWLEQRGPQPDAAQQPVFRPVMLAHPIEDKDLESLDWSVHRAEWKWDGIRVQLVAGPHGKRLYTRTADDISHAFPEILDAMTFHAVLDGELLVMRDGEVASFSDLQQRLNRKTVSTAMLRDYPVIVRLYDILFHGDADVRSKNFDERRGHLEAFMAHAHPAQMDLSPLVNFSAYQELAALRAGARAAGIEGLMIKHAESPYLAGRPKGHWWKWKRDPLSVDAVLMYAQRGHGKRSSYYSDYTFGLWNENGELVPIGKAYSGYTDAELNFLDKWIRNNTIGRFGPVREVAKEIVFEVGFDAAQRSTRHKSGVALRFPRILRLRTDKPATEADRLESFKTTMKMKDLS